MKNGNEMKVRLTDVIIVPGLTTNLLSLTQMKRNEWTMKGNMESMDLKKGDIELSLNNKEKYGSRYVFSIDI